MGKRSTFERRPQDAYDTPYAAVVPLLPHLSPGTIYGEPCAGVGALVDHLDRHGHACIEATDIEPRRFDVIEGDATVERYGIAGKLDCLVTNPPWSRQVLHKIIANLSAQRPTWLLFDADWAHTVQAERYLPLLRKIVAVGRIKWIPDSKFTGKDNCCWYLFDAHKTGPIEFVGRAAELRKLAP